MNILGWVIAGVGLILAIFGIFQMLKSKKMQTVPYRKPSEIAQMGATAADAKGLVSTEGKVQPGPQALTAPMSGQPCLAYEITVERKWEKQVMTEKGRTTKTGTDKIHTERKGAVFNLSDGTGQVIVDATQELDADMDKSHSSSVSVGSMIPGTLHFGSLQLNTPHLSHDARTTSFVGTEKILKPSETLYALGALSQGQYGLSVHTPKGIGTGKLILSHHGRAKLLSKTKRNMILGFVFGGVMVFGGGGLGLFGPKSSGSSCASTIDGPVSCDGRIYTANGIDYTWKVTESGFYSLTAIQPPGLKFPIDSVITIFDGSGNKVAYNDGGGPGKNAHIQQKFEPGTYKLTVSDYDKYTVDGGFGFHLAIQKAGSAPPAATGAPSGAPSAVASTTPAVLPAHPVPGHPVTPAPSGAAHTAPAPATTGAAHTAPAAPKK